MSLVFIDKAPSLIADSSLNAVADDHIRPVVKHYMAQMQRLQDQVPKSTVARLLEQGASKDAIIDALPFNKVFGTGALGAKAAAPKKSLQSFFESEFTAILIAAGVATTAEMAQVIPAIGVVGPGALAADSAAWAAQNSAKLVTNVSKNTKNAIRATITSGIVANRTPQQIAQDIQLVIGLRAPQAASLLQFGAQLARQDVPLGEVSRRLAQVKTGFLQNRGMLISRTETINATNGGQQLAWRASQREGILTDENSRKAWIVTEDDLLDLNICAPMPDMDENLDVKIGDYFTAGNGATIEHPTAHPNCRCAQGLVVLSG
jgi:hypothetical protein